jgi:hypothetical protein
MQEPVPADRIAAQIDDVLRSGEFSDEKTLLEELFDWLGQRFHWQGAGDTVQVLMWVFAGAVVLLTLWLLVRAVRMRLAEQRLQRAVAAAAAGPDARERVRDLRRRALEARRSGDLRLALRLSFFALVVGLGERGDLRYREAWTYRELLRRGRPSRPARELLEPLVAELEAKEFGRAPASEQDLDRLETLCDRHLGPLPSERAPMAEVAL